MQNTTHFATGCGDQIDADEFVREHIDAVFRLAYRLTGNRHEADDLTQDTFVRAFRALSTYQQGNMAGWLHRITTNLFLDSVRRKRRIQFDAFPDGLAELLRSPGAEPDEQHDMQSLDDDVREALMGLKPMVRAAVVLCDLEGFSYDDIAATLGVKSGTVRSRIHRGRAQLRRELAHRRPQLAAGSARTQTKAASA